MRNVLMLLVIGSIPLAIIGGLSRFQPQNSSYLQRVLILGWVFQGIVVGSATNMLSSELGFDWEKLSWRRALLFPVCSLLPVGGMVVAGLMIHDYGICQLLVT